MYIVRDKKTKKIIHVNPAPLSQQLKGKGVYFKFDPKKMEIGETEGNIPEHFNINKKGKIVELTLEEKIKANIITLQPEQKIVKNQIVEKTLSEKVADGVITIPPSHKIIGEGKNQRSVEKTLSEKVAEGLVTLLPTQKITGKGIDERIVDKTITEKVKEGLIKLAPTQKIIGTGEAEQIVEKTISEQVKEGIIKVLSTQKIIGEGENEEIVEKSKQELLDEGLITLEDIKEEHIQRLRNDTDAFLSRHKTPNGYQLDQLTRQKANFSYQFRHLPNTDENKKNFLEKRLIYPDNILDEIVAEIAKVQAAYDTAKKKIINAYENKEPVSVFESISLEPQLQAHAASGGHVARAPS